VIHRRSRRLAAAAVGLVFLVLAGSAGARISSPTHASSLKFTALARRWVQRDLITVAVSVRPAGVVCQLSVRYADGQLQPNLMPVGASDGHAKWKFHIGGGVQPGRARVRVSCGRAGGATRTVLVVGSVIPARIVVVKDGYSVKQNQYGGGSISWGVILRNTSPQQDALDVYTLVNFVGMDNRLVGSATNNLSGIPAGKDFALGDNIMFFGGVPPISRLEVVVQIKKRQAHALKLPTITNVRIWPGIFDSAYVGSVDGEVSNDNPRLVLRNAELSTVVLDAQGNVLGGGSGFAFASLPPNAREFFKIERGLDAIPMYKAASAMVSAIGQYDTP
jgi:hypothetical protein